MLSKKRAVKRSNTSLKDLSKVLEDHGRHSMLSFLSSLPISVLRILDTEANKFYPSHPLNVHFISSQSLNLGGRRGTTDDVATIPFHPSLSSAALRESPNPIPVHSLMLSKKRAVKRSNTSLKDLSKVLEDHGRHSMLSFLSSLPISVLRILDTEANKFYPSHPLNVHFISSQSLNLGGRRGTTDDVATIPFHPSLSSAVLRESPNPIPVHSLMLSKKRAVKRSNTSLKDLSKVLEDHGRHSMLSFLSSLPISVLRILVTEANKFYDRNHQLYDAALLTRCYTQHALRPFIDSETNHKRHFIKIPFINKGIEFIDLSSIFKDRSITSSIPTYFQNSEPPIICYKYNKPIKNAVFNLFLILTFMQTLLSHEIVKIPNLFILQPVI